MRPRLECLHLAPAGPARPAPPLLFLHGAFCGAWCWEPYFMPWFAARGYDCHALSFEGHGGSEGQAYLPAISIDDYRRNLDDTIRTLPAPPVVIAHSMGGYVLQQWLPKQTLPGAVFLASVPPSGMAGGSLNLMMRAPELFLKLNLYQQGSYDPDTADLAHMLFATDPPDTAVRLLAARAQKESQRAIMDMALANPLLQRKPPPLRALVLGASEDLLIPPADVVATARLYDCEARILPHLGHMMMLDGAWESAARDIADWLDTL